ncbi:hypothetical protein [Streptomyces sp. NPDC048560]|uniref:hypothetical protein n=1 Tax=Streptomyces sp. NPDC048560 TaxID=3155488 RepID=UPI00341BCC23
MFKALIDLGKSRAKPGEDDRSGLIEDIQKRYGTAGDEAPRKLGNVVGESATLLYAVFGDKGSEGIREFFQRPEILELCDVPLDSPSFDQACETLATKENGHWKALAEANPDAPGPAAGAAFSGAFRDYIQRGVATVVQSQDRMARERNEATRATFTGSLASTVANLKSFPSGQTTTTAAGQSQGSASLPPKPVPQTPAPSQSR